MTVATVTEAWKIQADAVARRRGRVWIGCGLLGAGAGAAIIVATRALTPEVRLAALALAGLLFAATTLWSTVIYMRGIDEQERDANLWSCYVGMCVYFVLFGVTFAARMLGHPLPQADIGTFIITVATVLAVFAWKRFR